MISVGLVVDDDPHMRRLLSEALRRGGICVLEAKSGREALKLTQTAVPHFVVTDLDMPDVDGLELCRRLRQLAATSNVPIVVVSGAAAAMKDHATAAGCDVVLAKPVFSGPAAGNDSAADRQDHPDQRASSEARGFPVTVTQLILLAMALFVIVFAARFFLSSRK